MSVPTSTCSVHEAGGSPVTGLDDAADVLLDLRGLRRTFNADAGVFDVSLSVPQGAVYVLCGPNGAGKTTTLSVVAGLLFASTGSLRLQGRNIPLDRSAPRAGMGYVPEMPVLDPRLTPLQWAQFVADLKGVALDPSWEEWADRLLLTPDHLSRRSADLSFGNRRKVALWVEFVTADTLILADEPHIGLDPLAIEGFHDAARRYVESGRSIVISTHLLREAEAVATHVGVLADGRTVASGPIRELSAEGALTDLFARAVGFSSALKTIRMDNGGTE